MTPYPKWLLEHPQLTDGERWTWLVLKDMQDARIERTNKVIGDMLQLTDVGARARLVRMRDKGVVTLRYLYPQRWDAIVPEGDGDE